MRGSDKRRIRGYSGRPGLEILRSISIRSCPPKISKRLRSSLERGNSLIPNDLFAKCLKKETF